MSSPFRRSSAVRLSRRQYLALTDALTGHEVTPAARQTLVETFTWGLQLYWSLQDGTPLVRRFRQHTRTRIQRELTAIEALEARLFKPLEPAAPQAAYARRLQERRQTLRAGLQAITTRGRPFDLPIHAIGLKVVQCLAAADVPIKTGRSNRTAVVDVLGLLWDWAHRASAGDEGRRRTLHEDFARRVVARYRQHATSGR